MLKSPQEDYEITEDYTGEKYLGLNINWDYINMSVLVSMPGYVKAVLLKFQREAQQKPKMLCTDGTRPCTNPRPNILTPTW